MNHAKAQGEFPFEGPIPDESVLPRLAAWLGRIEWSGQLAVRSGEIERRLLFLDGRVQSATSSDPGESLTAWLVSSGIVDAEAVDRAAEQQGSQDFGLGFARRMVKLGLLRAADLAKAEEERVVALAEGILALRSGVYRCEADAPPVEMISHALDVPRLVATSVLNRWDETWAMNVLGGMGTVLRLNLERLPEQEATGAAEAYDLTLLRVDGRSPLSTVLERSPLPELPALRFLAASHLLGIVETCKAGEAAPLRAASAPASAPGGEALTTEAPRRAEVEDDEPSAEGFETETDALEASSEGLEVAAAGLETPDEAPSVAAASLPEPAATPLEPEEGDVTSPGFYRPKARTPSPRAAEPLMKAEVKTSGVGRWLLIALILGLLGVVAWFSWVGLSAMSKGKVPAGATREAAP